MKKGKKKWLTLVAAVVAAAIAVLQPELIPVVGPVLDEVGVPELGL